MVQFHYKEECIKFGEIQFYSKYNSNTSEVFVFDSNQFPPHNYHRYDEESCPNGILIQGPLYWMVRETFKLNNFGYYKINIVLI